MSTNLAEKKQRISNLSSKSPWSSWNLWTVIFNKWIYPWDAYALSRTCKAIQSQLTSLTIDWPGSTFVLFNNSAIRDIYPGMIPSALAIADKLTVKSRARLADGFLQHWLPKSSRLTSIDVNVSRYSVSWKSTIMDGVRGILDMPPSQLKHLGVLYFPDDGSGKPDDASEKMLSKMIERHPTIRTLEIHRASSSMNIPRHQAWLSNLQRLTLPTYVGDSTLGFIAKQCPLLEQLELSSGDPEHRSGWSGPAFLRLMQALRFLKSFSLPTGLSSDVHAVDWCSTGGLLNAFGSDEPTFLNSWNEQMKPFLQWCFTAANHADMTLQEMQIETPSIAAASTILLDSSSVIRQISDGWIIVRDNHPSLSPTDIRLLYRLIERLQFNVQLRVRFAGAKEPDELADLVFDATEKTVEGNLFEDGRCDVFGSTENDPVWASVFAGWTVELNADR